MDPEERLEKFRAIVAELSEANEASPVIVEGIRDERALRELGLSGRIVIYNRGVGMANVADHLRGERALIVLFDWDRKGGQLSHLLQRHGSGGPNLDLRFRRELARLSPVKCVEDLPAALRTLTRRATERKTEERSP